MDKLRHYVGAVCVYPLAGHLFFDICDKADVRLLRYAHIGVLGNAFEGDNTAAFALERGFYARAAAVERLGHVYSCLNVRRTALQGGKLDCPCFYAVIFRDFAREEPCGAGKLLMPECVDIVDVVAELDRKSVV